ncbi:hypothetical protein [Nonlabens tegetincola]|uniref:hypothetical protein n=1 Tax=Nonlabens tegetincola TaxID=323273 RepID=UPI000CF4FD41|nr:hypothetical protein [Nonlabens tegetincola]PQJ19314.1 hypothetical protein BST93_06050 [Nonlabens tegetincola]
MKKIIALATISLIVLSCNSDKKNNSENLDPIPSDFERGQVIENNTDGVWSNQVDCDGAVYKFEIPKFSGTQTKSLYQPISNLIGKDLSATTYPKDATMEEVFDIFANERSMNLCLNKDRGTSMIKIDHVSENTDFISYSIVYKREGEFGRILRTFSKPNYKEIKLNDMVSTKKFPDVRTILQVNLQQETANLILGLPKDMQATYGDYARNTAFTFTDEELKNAPVAFKVDQDKNVFLQTTFKVDLPDTFKELNNQVLITIPVDQLSYYMDFEKVIKG